jgi:hypothetical protein
VTPYKENQSSYLLSLAENTKDPIGYLAEAVKAMKGKKLRHHSRFYCSCKKGIWERKGGDVNALRLKKTRRSVKVLLLHFFSWV